MSRHAAAVLGQCGRIQDGHQREAVLPSAGFIPITFETGVLFGALAQLWDARVQRTLSITTHFQSVRFERVTDDRFPLNQTIQL